MEESPFNDLDKFPEIAPPQTPAVLAEAAIQREIAEVQGAMIIAKKFPRNQAQAVERIMIACQRQSLAEEALYSYSRGGTEITGPSIRLAEAIAQQWGNLSFGIRELEQRLGESTIEAYAWDLETNTRQNKVFQVRHMRYTRKGSYDLQDPRDIYEMVANQGARRLRACILGIVPGDVVESAKNQCETTLKVKADISPEAVQKMLTVFGEVGVNKEMIEKRIQRKLESITPAQIIGLRKIYNSIKDGMSNAGDWFETSPVAQTIQNGQVPQGDRIKDELKKRGRPPKTSEKAPESPQDAPEGGTATQGQGDAENAATGDTGPQDTPSTKEQRDILNAADEKETALLLQAWREAGIDPTKSISTLNFNEADALIGTLGALRERAGLK